MADRYRMLRINAHELVGPSAYVCRYLSTIP